MEGEEAGIKIIDLNNPKSDPIILGKEIGRIVGAHFNPDGRWLGATSIVKGAEHLNSLGYGTFSR